MQRSVRIAIAISALMLNAVVSHYQQVLKFTLSDQERRDLIEYLKSL